MKANNTIARIALTILMIALGSSHALAAKKVKASSNHPSGGFVEPFIGYSMGTYNYSVNGDTSLSKTVSQNGAGYGLRAGYVRGGFFIAPRFELVPNNTQYGIDLGGTISKAPVRILFGINFKDTVYKTSEANGYKFGVGYFISNYLALNIDYTYRTFAASKTAAKQTINKNYNNLLLSLSIPITFGCPPMPVMAEQGESLMNMFSAGDND